MNNVSYGILMNVMSFYQAIQFFALLMLILHFTKIKVYRTWRAPIDIDVSINQLGDLFPSPNLVSFIHYTVIYMYFVPNIHIS